jgi:Holliday junction DNA helicase RuvA
MIGALSVDVVDNRDGFALLKVQGCGIWYEAQTSGSLPDARGSLVAVHVISKEDGQTMFAFASESERDLFRNLLTAKGVGGGTALRILRRLRVSTVLDAIERGDAAPFLEVKGIGRKAAESILKVKV